MRFLERLADPRNAAEGKVLAVIMAVIMALSFSNLFAASDVAYAADESKSDEGYITAVPDDEGDADANSTGAPSSHNGKSKAAAARDGEEYAKITIQAGYPGGETIQVDDEQLVGETYIAPHGESLFTNVGYSFTGWVVDLTYDDYTDQVELQAGQTIQAAPSMTFTAQWERIGECQVTVNYYRNVGDALHPVDVPIGPSETFNAYYGSTVDEALLQNRGLIRDYNGFQFFGMRALDGSTSMKVIEDPARNHVNLYYESATSISYTVEYYYEKDDGDYSLEEADGTEVRYELDNEIRTVAGGTFGTAVTYYPIDNLRSGYYLQATNGPVILGSNPSENVMKVYFRANPATYNVNHYIQELNGDYILYATDENLSSKVGVTITAYPRSITGFKLNLDAPDTLATTTMPGESYCELNLYYDRQTYQVTYEFAGDVPENADEILPATQTYAYEEWATPAQNPSAAGYSFSGWSQRAPFLVTSDVTITGYWTALSNIPYTVRHHLQNLDDDDYTLDREIQRTGTTGTTVYATPLSYDGFVFNAEASKAGEDGRVSGTIAGDGSLVIDLYYDRPIYTVSYAYTGDVPIDAPKAPEAAQLKRGAMATVADEPALAGHTFSGWSRQGTFEVTEDVVITGSWTQRTDYSYEIHYWQQALDGSYEEVVADGQSGTGTYEQLVTADKKTYTGFTFNEEASTTEGELGEEPLVLDLYYDRAVYPVTYEFVSDFAGDLPDEVLGQLPPDGEYAFGAPVDALIPNDVPGYTFKGWTLNGQPLGGDSDSFTMPAGEAKLVGTWAYGESTYTVVSHWQNADDEGYSDTFEVLEGTTGSQVTVEPASQYGFAFDPEGSVLTATVAADGTTELHIYYVRQLVNVSYAYTGEVPAGASELPQAKDYRFGARVDVEPPAHADGYVFGNWSRTGTFTIQSTDSIVITGSFDPATNVEYRIVYYKQDVVGEGYSQAETLRITEGTTGETVTAGEPSSDFTGFTLNPDAPGSVLSGVVEPDGSLVLMAYYDRNVNEVSYRFEGFVPNSVRVPAAQDVRYEADLPLPEITEPQGYVFDGWMFENHPASGEIMPNEDAEIVGYWSAAQVPYTVRHYLQAEQGNSYEQWGFDETYYGEFGDEAIADFNTTITGFHPNESRSTTSASIAADGSTVLNLYYDRNVHEVSYSINGDEPEGMTALPATVEVRYGAPVELAASPSAPGYTFQGWSYTSGFSMPDYDVEVFGWFTPNDDTNYYVEYYQQTLDGTAYERVAGDQGGYSAQGITGQTVIAQTADFAGFVLADGQDLTGVISGTQPLVIKVYYDRLSYDVSYDFEGDVPDGAVIPDGAYFPYGTTITLPAVDEPSGYAFEGWFVNGQGAALGNTVTVEDDLQLVGKWSRQRVGYAIEHWFQSVSDSGYARDDSATERFDSSNGEYAGDTATARYGDFEGFTPNPRVSGTIESAPVAGDGSTILRLYYDRNTYDLTYEYAGDVLPIGAPQLPETATYRYGENVGVYTVAPTGGYTFGGWFDNESGNRVGSSYTMPARDVVLSGEWGANYNTPYRIVHHWQNLDGQTYSMHESTTLSATTDTTVTALPNEYAGFVLNEDRSGVDSEGKLYGVVAGDGSLTLDFYYDRQTYTISGTIDGVSYGQPQTVRYGDTSQPMLLPIASGLRAASVVVNGQDMDDFRNHVRWDASSNSNCFVFDAIAGVDRDYTVELTTADRYAITVAVTSQSKIYDGTPVSSQLRFEGLPSGYRGEGSVESSAADAGTYDVEVGDYKLFDEQGNDVTDDFAVTPVAGRLTVTPRAVSIIVNNASKQAGEADPAFSGYVEGGLVANGDLGEITYYKRINNEAPGSYPNAIYARYTENSNYDVSVRPGALVIRVAAGVNNGVAGPGTYLPDYPTPTPGAGNPATLVVNAVGDLLTGVGDAVADAIGIPVDDNATPMAEQASPRTTSIDDEDNPLAAVEDAGFHMTGSWTWLLGLVTILLAIGLLGALLALAFSRRRALAEGTAFWRPLGVGAKRRYRYTSEKDMYRK